MTGDQLRRLVENIRRDGVLTSLPLVYTPSAELNPDFFAQSGGAPIIVSGNHRVEAAREAGLEVIDVIELRTPVTDARLRAIQLSHWLQWRSLRSSVSTRSRPNNCNLRSMGISLDPSRPTVKPGPKGGRPRLQILPSDLAKIEGLAAVGCTLAEIAHVIGITDRQLDRWLKHKEVAQAHAKGKSGAIASVGKKLYDKAIGGDVTAIIWFEKTRAKRSERVHVVNEDEATAIQQKLAAMSTEQLRRVANGESPAAVLGE